MTLPKAIILEIDGILADDSHRKHFIDYSLASEHMNWLAEAQNWEPDYESYYAAMDKDTVNEWCADLVYSWYLYEAKPTILIVTEIPWRYQGDVETNISKAFSEIERTKYIKLFMRPDFLPVYPAIAKDGNLIKGDVRLDKDGKLHRGIDNRPSHVVKREIYDLKIKDKYDILFVLERSGLDADMYRELGLTVLEVR